MKTVFDDLEARFDSLSPSEQRVGRWLRDNVVTSINAPLAEVAERSGVSEPTVIRFCRSMGLSGFRELRTELVAARQQPESYVHHDVSALDSVSEAAGKVLDSTIRSLVNLRADLGRMPVEEVANIAAGARQIIFMGMGASGAVAEDARHKFFRLGIPCSVALDPQTILQQSAVVQSGDVLIAISHTGEWPDLIRGISLATSRGATCVAVTDPVSLLAKSAAYNFNCKPREDTTIFTPMTSRIAQLVILDALQIAVALAMGESAESNLKQSKEALTAYRQQWKNGHE